MSFDTGRKLGITSSIIAVIAPIITVIIYGIAFFALIRNISSIVSNGGVPTSPLASMGFVSLAATIVGLTTLVGAILFLVSMYELSHYYNEPGIFRNFLYAIITAIVGGVIIAALAIAFVFSAIATAAVSPIISSFFWILIGLIIAFFVVIIVAYVFVLRGFNLLGDKSDVHSFNTAGILLLIGAIIPFVGGILSWIGWIFALSGFIALKPKLAETSTYYGGSTATTVNPNIVVCPNCGAQNSVNATFCWSCGKSLSKVQT